MTTNLNTAANSDGTLNEQADIYAKSWEAARNRVKSAMEEIYSQLLNDDFFITLTDGFAGFLNILSDTINTLGGIPGVLSLVSAGMLKAFGPEVANGIRDIVYGLKDQAAAEREIKTEATEAAKTMLQNRLGSEHSGEDSGFSTGYQEQLSFNQAVVEKKKELQKIGVQLSEADKETINVSQELLALAQERTVAAGINVDTQNKELEILRDKLLRTSNLKQIDTDDVNTKIKNVSATQQALKIIREQVDATDDLKEQTQAAAQAAEMFIKIFEGEGLEEATAEMQNFLQKIQNGTYTRKALYDSERKNKTQRENANVSTIGLEEDLDEEQTKYLEDMTDKAWEAGAAVAKLGAEQIRLKNTSVQAKAAIEAIKGVPPDAIDGVVSLGRALSTVSMVANSVYGIFKTWNNEDMSFGEKLISTFTTLGMVIPMVATSLKGANMAFTLQSISALEASLGVKALTVEEIKSAIAKEGLAKATWKVLAPLAPYAAAIAAVVAAIALLVAAYKRAQEASPEGRLKQAKEEAENLSEALDEARTNAENLQSAFDEYQSILDKLNSCTKGTQEWSEALEEASSKTTELLQKYPELLSSGNLFDNNGLLNIDVLAEAVEKADKTVSALSAASLTAQARVSQAQVAVDTDNFAKKYYTESSYDKDGAVIDSVTYFNQANDDLQKMLDRTIGSTASLEDAYRVLGVEANEQQKLATALVELTNESIAASNSLNNSTKSIINDWASGQGLTLQKGQAELMQQAYQEVYDKVKKEAEQSANASNKISNSVGTFRGKSLWDAYNEANGSNYVLSNNGVQGSGKNRVFEYIGEDNEKKTVTAQEVAATIAASQALEQLGVASKDATEVLRALSENVPDDIAEGLKNWIADNNFESMTEDQFRNMTENLQVDNSGNYTESSVRDYLSSAFGEDFEKILGEDWYKKFNSAAVNFNTALNSIEEGLSQTVQGIYNSLEGLDQLSVGSQINIANLLQEAFNANGSEGTNALSGIFEKMLEDGKTEELEEFSGVLNSFDWKTGQVGEFRNALINAGVDVEALGFDIREIFNTLSDISSTELSGVQATYKAIQDIIKDLATGGTISDEDYNKLSDQLGADVMDGFFSVMADGTHQLVGNAEEFKNAVNSISKEQFINNISSASSTGAALQGSSAQDLNDGVTSQSEGQVALAYLNTLELAEEEANKVAEIQDKFAETGILKTGQLNDLMKNHIVTEEEYGNTIEQNNLKLRENSEALLSTATTLEEFDHLVEEVGTATQTSENEVLGYNEALINLASQYDNCTDEIEDFQRAIREGDSDTISAAKNTLKLAISTGELAKEHSLDGKSLNNYATRLADSNKSLKNNATAAATAATQNQRLDRGLTSLNKNLSDYKKKLDQSNKGTSEWSDTMDDLKEDLGDILNIDAGTLSDDFANATLNSEDLQAALGGDSDAILRLKMAAGDDIIAHLEVEGDDLQTVETEWANIKNFIENNDINSPKVNQSELINSFNNMIAAGNMTKEQIEGALSALNVSADLDVDYKELTHKVPTQIEHSTASKLSDPVTETIDGVETLVTPSNWERRTWVTQGEPVIATEYVPQYSIKGKKGPGGVTTGITKLPAPTASRSSTSSGSGSGTGGRRNGRTGRKARAMRKSELDKKTLKDEQERYYKVNNQLDNINDNITKYDAIANRAFGKNRIKAINDTTNAYKKLADTTRQKLKEARDYQKKDRNKAKKYGWKFNADGDISNYDENIKKLVQEYNAAEDTYLKEINAARSKYASGSDALEKAEKKAEEKREKAHKKYENAIKAKEQIEETNELVEDLEQDIRDAVASGIDAALNAVEYTLEVKVELNDNKLNLLEALLNEMGDGADKATDAIANLGQQVALTNANFLNTKQGIKDLLSTYTDEDFYGKTALTTGLIKRAMSGRLTEKDYEKIKNITGKDGTVGISEDVIKQLEEYTQNLYSYAETLRSLRENALDIVSSAFDEYNEKLEENQQQIEHLQKANQTYLDIINIVGRKVLDQSGQLSKALNRSNWELQRNNTLALKEQMNFIQASIDNTKATIEELANEGGTSEALNKQLEEQEAKMREVSEAYWESWTAEFQGAADIFTSTIEIITDNLSDALAGALKSLDDLVDVFDRKDKIDELYLDDFEKIYELSKLNRDIEKSINDTDDLRNKAALKDLLEEINALEAEGVELSQYDVDNARRRYELELARQALEDAKKAKSNVRMVRDSEGNYGYVYTADEDAVEDAEQEYENKLYEMQKANKEYIAQLRDNIASVGQDFQNALSNLHPEDYSNPEEYSAAVEALYKDYETIVNGYYQQLENVLKNNKDLYENEWKNYSDMTGYKRSADEDYVDSFDETQFAIATGFESLGDAQTTYLDNMKKAIEDAMTAWYDYQKDTETAMRDGETSMEEFAETGQQVSENTQETGKKIQEEAKKLSDSFSTAFDDILKAMENFGLKYDSMIDDRIKSSNKWLKSLERISYVASGETDMGIADVYGMSLGDLQMGVQITQMMREMYPNKKYPDAQSLKNVGFKTKEQRNFIRQVADELANGATWEDIIEKYGFYDLPDVYNVFQSGEVKGFATGGYTGDWSGENGRLALLHQKELVLNQSDTSNILRAVEMIRSISRSIDLNALSASTATLTSTSFFSPSTGSNDFNQNVHITAEFPNATSSSEIESAFNTLINRAAQFANRK